MASRRDQLHSYQFLLQRVISALVMRETDPAQAPLRRGTGAIFAGIMIAVITAAGFGVYGIFTKIGSSSWKVDGSVVVEKESGAPYVFREGTLHPMLNYTSALLASGKQPPTSFRVPHASLSQVPHGVMLGIPNAPNSLPDRKALIGPPWTLCSVSGRDEANQATTTTTLVLSGRLTGGRRLDDDSGLLVRDSRGGTTFLVWDRHRYLINSPDTVIPSLFGAANSIDAGAAWVNGLPAGPEVGPIKVDRQGEVSAALPGRRNGDLLVAQTGSGPQYYLVFDDGLAAINKFQKAIVAGQGGAAEKSVTVSEATNARKSGRLASAAQGEAQLPHEAPKLVTLEPKERICAVSDDAQDSPAIWAGGSFQGLGDGIPTGSRSADGASLADRVAVPPGRIAVVRALASPTATVGSYDVVTDVGMRFPVAETVLGMLGYSAQDAVSMPASLVNRIPAGPTLDPLAAVQPAEVANRSGTR